MPTLNYHSSPVSVSPPVNQGVYYERSAFPGTFVRLLVCLIDVIVFFIVYGLTGQFFASMASLDTPQVAFVSFVLLGWIYLVLLKRSALGTLGYLIFRLRIVNLRGEPAGLARLTLRLAAAIIFNSLVDLLWSSSDASKQPLRDKISGTYVIRRGATPAGFGEFTYKNAFVLGMNLVFKEVHRANSPD
jgi:uncharacterized RDD family membrane protein YckC